MTKRLLMPKDDNNYPIQIMNLTGSQDVDGNSASVQSEAIDGKAVRIIAVGSAIRFAIGADPVATATSIYLPEDAEIWQPCSIGDKIAILGGRANIATAGI